jgi:DNA-binding NtrC family response regulator
MSDTATAPERIALACGKPDGQDLYRRTIRKKLLVIDDEAGVCTVIRHVATSLGLNSRAIREPLDATKAFVDFAPDVVLLDMIMPGRDGVDLLHEMLPMGFPARLILMSGYGETYMRLAQGLPHFTAPTGWQS